MIYEGDNMMGIKRTNRSAALRLLHERGSMSRKRLAESTKLTPAAITKIVGEMWAVPCPAAASADARSRSS